MPCVRSTYVRRYAAESGDNEKQGIVIDLVEHALGSLSSSFRSSHGGHPDKSIVRRPSDLDGAKKKLIRNDAIPVT